jgi:hypothetical protein
MFGTLSFMVEEDENIEYPAQEQEERHTMTIDFEFPQGLKNSATMFQQLVMTNPINSPV